MDVREFNDLPNVLLGRDLGRRTPALRYYKLHSGSLAGRACRYLLCYHAQKHGLCKRFLNQRSLRGGFLNWRALIAECLQEEAPRAEHSCKQLKYFEPGLEQAFE